MEQTRVALLAQISHEAGQILKAYFGRKVHMRTKSGTLDLVTTADEAAERAIVTAIRNQFPEDHILAEESGEHKGHSDYQWIIDPLDGTTNFAHGFPQFAVSIALAKGEELLAGVVYDPIKEEFFRAERGRGAFLNDAPIHVSECERLDDALTVTGFSYDRRERIEVLLERTRRILLHCRGMRRLGSAALDLAYLACGRSDVFLEDGLQAWDLAAGALLVQEAGGVTHLLDGASFQLFQGQIVATNSALKASVIKTLCT